MELLIRGAAALGIHLSLEQIERFRQYYELLIEWNRRINLTSVTGWEEMQATHFLDSLSASLAAPTETLESGRCLDVGSGAGFPGMALKIGFPRLKVTLIDSVAKKTMFLALLSAKLGLSGVDICTGRCETLAHTPALREEFDLVFVRAVASMSVLAELTLPFCRVGGMVIAQKKLGIEEEIRRGGRAIKAMGGELKEVRNISVPGLSDPRGLVVLSKVAPTPVRYPRRPGIPNKRPL